jgi:hypothetical protein
MNKPRKGTTNAVWRGRPSAIDATSVKIPLGGLGASISYFGIGLKEVRTLPRSSTDVNFSKPCCPLLAIVIATTMTDRASKVGNIHLCGKCLPTSRKKITMHNLV